MFLLCGVFIFVTVNHVFSQPVLPEGETYVPTWPLPPSVIPNFTLQMVHDNFYKKTVIEPLNPCWECLYYVTPVMIQHRTDKFINSFDHPRFNPRKLKFATNRYPRPSNVKFLADPEFFLVLPYEESTTTADCASTAQYVSPIDSNFYSLGRLEVINADFVNPLETDTDIYIHRDFETYNREITNGKAKMNFTLTKYKMAINPYYFNDKVRFYRTVLIEKDYPLNFLADRYQNAGRRIGIYDDLYGGNFSVTYIPTRAKILDVGTHMGCNAYFGITSRSRLELDETLKDLPDPFKTFSFPPNFHSDYYLPSFDSNVKVAEAYSQAIFNLQPNYIKVDLWKKLEGNMNSTIEFEYLEHPHALYTALITFTVNFTNNGCFIGDWHLFGNIMNFSFCDDKMSIQDKTYPLDSMFAKNFLFRKYRFFIPPINSDDLRNSKTLVGQPSRFYNGYYNLMLYIIRDTSREEQSERAFHTQHKIYHKIRMRAMKVPNRGDPFPFRLDYRTNGSHEVFLEIEGPGVFMKKVKHFTVDTTKQHLPVVDKKERMEVTRLTTQTTMTMEPRTDPTQKIVTTTLKVSTASMPMGIVIGLMVAGMIIILLWVSVSDIVCNRKKKKAVNAEPQPRAQTPMPQSVEDVKSSIKLSVDEPVSSQPAKKTS